MRKLGADALALAALTGVSLATFTGAGCSTTKPTELVPGVSSQVVVPHDLQAVRITVVANGQQSFDQCYPVGSNGVNGAVSLPSTLGVLGGGTGETVVKITVTGYDTPAGDCETGGTANVGTAGGPHILRRSIQTFVNGRTLFVPMPLTYSCWNTACGDPSDPTNTMACKGNTCVDTSAATNELVEFDPSLLDGTGSCFSPELCFGDKPEGGSNASFSPELVNPSDCTYAFPSGITPDSLNVRAYYQTFDWKQAPGGEYQSVFASGGEQEILNADPIEGFTLVNPTELGTPEAGAPAMSDGGTFAGKTLFRLAPGLCQLVHASTTAPAPPPGGSTSYITISDLRVANICPPKAPLLPICADEQTNGPRLPDGTTTTDGVCGIDVALAPTQSALYLVMDPSEVMHGAYGPDGSATALNLSLTDPVFKRTFAAFKFLPGNPADCTSTPTTSFTMPDIDFGLAADVQGQIASKLSGWTPPEQSVGTCGTSADCMAAAPVCANGVCIAPEPLELQAASRPDEGAYKHLTDFLNGKEAPNVAAAMFFVNRIPDLTNDCSPPLAGQATVKAALESQILAAYNGTPSLQTYFVVLDDDAHDSATGALPFFQQIQTDLPQAVQTLDATALNVSASTVGDAGTVADMQAAMNAQIAAVNFSKLVTQLGTCVYDSSGLPAMTSADGGIDPSTIEIAYAVPIPGQAKTVIGYSPDCTAAAQATADGWNFDGARIRICGNSCDQLRRSILTTSGAAAQSMLPAPDVPVTAAILCSGTSLRAGSGDASASSSSGGTSAGGGPDFGDSGTSGTKNGTSNFDGSFGTTTTTAPIDASAAVAVDGGTLP